MRPGSNYTIVALGRMVHEALKAAEQLKAFGIDAEVIDPRTLQPFDTETVVESVKKTHRALIVHEAVQFGGIGGEIAAQIQEEAFDYLDAPIARVGAPFSPVPFRPALEAHYVPNADTHRCCRAAAARGMTGAERCPRAGGIVGIIANPASGKDVRRLVARASVFDNRRRGDTSGAC